MTPQDDMTPTPPRWRAIIVPAATLLPPALLLAALLFHEEEEAVAPVAEEPVAALTLEPAGPPAPDPVVVLQATQDRVKLLEAELDAKQAELDELVAKGEKSRKDGAAKVAKLEKQIAKLKGDVASATAERDDLHGRLGTALADLEHEVVEHDKARAKVAAAEGANTENLWTAFTQQARIEMCQQVTKNGREGCGEKLAAWFGEERRDRFSACVTDSRTVPMLWRKGPDDEAPSNAELVDVSLFGHKKDWYVLYCDPTLPEAQLAAADLPPPVFVPSPWRTE